MEEQSQAPNPTPETPAEPAKKPRKPSLGCPTLVRIETTAFATPRDWEGYPEGYKSHPARNHPAAFRFLIERYTDPGDLVWDPMCGVGTTMFEAEKLGRQGFGWDIDPYYVELIEAHSRKTGLPTKIMQFPGRETVKAIITSPSFWDTNHNSGNTDTQKAYDAKIQSSAGKHYAEATIPGHLGQLKRRDEPVYWWLAGTLYRQCYDYLAPGGHMVLVLRDKVIEGQWFDYTRRNKILLEYMGYEIVGVHERANPKSARWQQREKLNPGQIHIDVENALVVRRPK